MIIEALTMSSLRFAALEREDAGFEFQMSAACYIHDKYRKEMNIRCNALTLF